MPKRIDKTNYYLDIAETVAERSTCLKRKYGAIIVKNDSLIAARLQSGLQDGVKDCLEHSKCNRQSSERGMDYSNCLAVHAEQNAIISASREQMIDSTLYLVGYEMVYHAVPKNTSNELGRPGLYPAEIKIEKVYVKDAEPCSLCKRLIINAGIKEVVVRHNKDPYVRIFNPKLWQIEDITGGY